ncbi:MAG: flagellar biosynthetic protein FliO [Gammaproteobacteria bacterium]
MNCIPGRPLASGVALALLLSTPTLSMAADAGVPASGLAGVASGLIAVLVLIVVLAWGVKRLQLGGGNAGAIRVIAATPLGARERILLVEVGDTQLLVGVGSGGMRTLHVLDQPLPTDPASQHQSPFARRMRDMVGGPRR